MATNSQQRSVECGKLRRSIGGSSTAGGRCPVQEPRQLPGMVHQVPRDRRRHRWSEVESFRGWPLERQMHHPTWLGHRFHRSQRRAQDCQLTRRVAGPAQRHAERVLDCAYPRRPRARRQFRDHGQRDGAELRRLDLTLYQSHGPAAHRSNRDQHHYVDMLLAKLPYHPGHALPQEPLRPEGVAYV